MLVLLKKKKRKPYMLVTWQTVELTKVQLQVTRLRISDVMFTLKSRPFLQEDWLTLQ